MSAPTTLLSPRMTELLKGVVDLEIASQSDSTEDQEKLRETIMIEIVGAYTSVEKQIAAHQGPYSQFFRDGLAERFKKTGYVSVDTASEVVSQMIYEHQLKAGRKVS